MSGTFVYGEIMILSGLFKRGEDDSSNFLAVFLVLLASFKL